MTTTIGVKLDDGLRARLRSAADTVGRTPHWLIKQAIVSTLERLERGEALIPEPVGKALDLAEVEAGEAEAPQPFLDFAQSIQPQSVLRAAITAAYRRPEPECLPGLIAEAALPPELDAKAAATARKLVEALRAKPGRGAVEGLIQEYALSSQEGVALMCLAEALLRIPDRATRDALIRDKISLGDWQSHLGHSPSLFVNAATWGLLVTGRLTATASESGLTAALGRLIGRGGEPVIRRGVDLAMRMLGEQFVTGQTIAEALANARRWEAKGFRYSYDMLGEAATNAADAARYTRDYEQAIHAIGKAAAGRGIYEGPGISVKLSALHPRYARAQQDRVMAELLPRLQGLAALARRYDIGVNIDAEEADRLEVSLDLLEALCFAPELAGWNGIGFVVQAYQKRASPAIDYLIDLARRSRRRLMIRLVKGAYWDGEIKRAQVDGLEGFPVFTRKLHTDVSYLACARKLLAAPDAAFPQFATHNARTLAAIHAMAGANYYAGQYEFQCLHGMGEPLYEEVVGPDKLGRPCRVYAPVGSHERLLAYLVRRLLENGANTSFVNRVGDAAIGVEALIADPVAEARAILPQGAPHPKIALPRDLYGSARANSAGIDLANEQRLASLSAGLLAAAEIAWRARPAIAGETLDAAPGQAIRNPADRRDLVGTVIEATLDVVERACAAASPAAAIWAATPPTERAEALLRAADLLETRLPRLVSLLVREAGKTIPNAVGEIREAVDFLRYYSSEACAFSNDTHRPLGPVACISPWNFPLAIFLGQVAAALAAGNAVLAKPAEETPLVAAEAVRILHEAGVPAGAVQLLPGDGRVGAALVANPCVAGVVFTGSTEVARLIQRQLATRLSPAGTPIPLIAETGGLNAMVVDSSALPEQVVADVLASAFDSAGQRCSALRVLCLQEEAADAVLGMLQGALATLRLGNPDRLSTDIGPVISAAAAASIERHIEAMRAAGHRVTACDLPPSCRHGSFVAPTLIEIARFAEVETEVFGPVLHILRYRRQALGRLLDEIEAAGYGLTFGLHTRIDETIAEVTARVTAGNIYVNRNIVGAVVGVQPFGGRGLSGTGPKAGGPLYLRRLLTACPAWAGSEGAGAIPDPARTWAEWLETEGWPEAAEACRDAARRAPTGTAVELPGPVGERNLYRLSPRGRVLCVAESPGDLLHQIGVSLASGNVAIADGPEGARAALGDLPPALLTSVRLAGAEAEAVDLVLFAGDADGLLALQQKVAGRPGAIVPILALPRGHLEAGRGAYPLEWFAHEQSISTNTAAAGGNASLMTIG